MALPKFDATEQPPSYNPVDPTRWLHRRFKALQQSIAFPEFMRGLLDDTSASAARTTLGLGTAAVESYTGPTAWTPVLRFGTASTGITYGTQLGRYARVGRLYFVQFRITLTSNGSATGAADITGLPATVLNSTVGNATGTCYYANCALLTDGMIASPVGNTTRIDLYYGGAASVTQLTDANITDTADIFASVFYMADA